MKIERIVPDLTVTDLTAAVQEHTQVLGLRVVMDHGWIVTLADDAGHQLSLMTADATAGVNPDVSVFVDDVRAAYNAAVSAGLEIVHRSRPRSGASPGSSTATRPAGSSTSGPTADREDRHAQTLNRNSTTSPSAIT